MKYFFEVLPGALSWGFLIFLLVTIFISPALGAIFIITFDLYWVLRIGYLTTLMVLGHIRLHKEEKRNWLEMAGKIQSPNGSLKDIFQAVLFPIYNESYETLDTSLKALKESQYDLKRIIVILATEERAGRGVYDQIASLKEKYYPFFKKILLTVHPDGLEGEARVKGANATWAARELKAWLDSENIRLEKVLISCFDADTICHPKYLACLAHAFLSHPRPYHASYQPIPVYHNNIWHAPSFARVVEISSSFWQLVQSVRRDKLVTFSSHSMAFKTLVEIGYWPVDMVSDDSAIFWKAYLHFDSDYHVIPLSVTVSMDVAFDKNLIRTVMNQYRQKRRWAWGVENFPRLMEGFFKNHKISLLEKMKRTLQLLEEHFTWATWAIVLAVIGPFPVIFGNIAFKNTLIGFNLPFITAFLLSITSVCFIICILASFVLLPPKPNEVPSYRIVTMCTQWLLIPVVSAIIGSIPALDAQTRLMIGRPLTFWVTPKKHLSS